MLVLLWIAALWKFVSALLTLPPLAHRLDFVSYYDSALAMRQGLDPYTSNLSAVGNRFGLETGPLIHAVDTPPLLLLLEPLTLFTPGTAFWIWTSFNLVVLAIGIYLLLIRRPGLDANMAWLLGALILAFYPVGWNFFWGQTQVIVLVLMVCATRAMEDEHDGAAGLFVALAGLLRAYPFLLLGYFALRRNWRAVKFTIAGALVGALIPALVFGFARCFSWVDGAVWVSNHDRMIFPFNISVAPFVSRMYWALLGPTAADWGRRAVILAADAIFLGMTVRATLASFGRRDDDFRIYSLWIVTTVLLSPVSWHHFLALLVLPFVQIAIAVLNDRARPRELWMAVASYLLACVSVPITFQLLAHPSAFQRAFPSLSAPLVETGFFTLLMAYVAVYWFVADMKSDERAVESPDLIDQASRPLKAIGA
jgi:Glycosyltransferase family 87